MARKFLWDEQEALLLLDAYGLIQKNPSYKSAIIRALSTNLRRRAIDNGKKIDDIFRNVSGINMRLQEIEKIINPKGSGISNTSDLFRKTVDLYLHHSRSFQTKLKAIDEYRVKISSDLVSFDKYESALLLDGYLGLSMPNETRAHMARYISMKLRVLAMNRGHIINEAFRSERGINGRLRKMGFAFLGKHSENEPVPQIFIETVDLYRNHKTEYRKLLTLANKWSGVILLPEDKKRAEIEKQKQRDASPVKKTQYVATKQDRKLQNDYPKCFKAVFSTLENRYYSNPKGVTATEIFSDLKRKYLRRDIITILSGASWAVEIKKGKFIHKAGETKMADAKANEKSFYAWIEKRLSRTQYKKMQSEKSNICTSLLSHKVINKPLFLIDEIAKVEAIEARIPSCFPNIKTRSIASQLISLYKDYLLSKVLTAIESTSTLQIEDARYNVDASQTEFYNWLSQHELLAGPTCRSYVSGVRSSEAYAKEHSYSYAQIFGVEKEYAHETIKTLLNDESFIGLHASYRSYLRKYLTYLGIEEKQSEKPSSSQEQHKETFNVDQKLVQAIEETVKTAGNGILKTELRDRFNRYSDSVFTAAIREADIISVVQKYYHRDNIEDFDLMADILLRIIQQQFKVFGDYTSATQLYKEASLKLDDFFFYNGAFDSRQEVFDLAAYLFGKKRYKEKQFEFFDGRLIWQNKPDHHGMDFSGVLVRYARNHGNSFSRDDAINLLEMHGSGTPSQTVSLILTKSGKSTFLQFAENRFVIAEALNIDTNFLELLRNNIEVLLDGEDYVSLDDIEDYFYNTLPSLPDGIIWGPLLLESILEVYDIGYYTIDAGESNDLKVIDAALVRKNSAYKSFSDIVWNEMNNDFKLPKTFTNEEFRKYLLSKGFIHGMEKVNTVHKTVANDLRFYWTDNNSMVTVSK